MSTPAKEIRIVFDGSPGPIAGRFVEVENEHQQSLKFGEWHEASNGWWELRFPNPERLISALRVIAADYNSDGTLLAREDMVGLARAALKEIGK